MLLKFSTHEPGNKAVLMGDVLYLVNLPAYMATFTRVQSTMREEKNVASQT